ncbi:MAG: hypothetical protein CL946_03665 [Ectothiorhodospiraceae bacterium]|nr:hypothetical protein [Ectothiorhodospiraceae bacterium]
MLFKRIGPRPFEYTPRYYDPEKDPEKKRRERFKFRSHVRRGKKPSALKILLFFLVAILAYLALTGNL